MIVFAVIFGFTVGFLCAFVVLCVLAIGADHDDQSPGQDPIGFEPEWDELSVRRHNRAMIERYPEWGS